MVKNIKLCEGHKGGFGLVKIMSPNVTYRNTPITKLKVIVVDKTDCVQCKSNKKGR
jgi:hypothetical protein